MLVLVAEQRECLAGLISVAAMGKRRAREAKCRWIGELLSQRLECERFATVGYRRVSASP
ncbi:MAG: hypothetical protein ACRC7G_16635 [Beijerinckiaceae bacterium]